MATSETNSATVTGDGDSDWVPLGPKGVKTRVTIDSVDANGDSAGWSTAEAALLFSPDAKMRSAISDPDGTAVSGQTDGFSRDVEGPGFVAVEASGGASVNLKIMVT